MGSEQGLLTVEETAKILGVTGKQVQHLSRQQLLEPLYPNGRRGGQHFREEDVRNLHELRQQEDLHAKLPQLAMRAILVSRRLEKQLDEIRTYLGLDGELLNTEKEEVVSLFCRAESFLGHAGAQEEEILFWARTLLGITEEYLGLVKQHLGEEEPWRLYYEVHRKLVERCAPGTRLRVLVEHAKRNLRNVTYFYIRGAHGERVAGRAVPREGYSRRIIQTLFPLQ